MALDVAIDFSTGDLIVAPTKDLDVRVGEGTIEQRIRVRLKVKQGTWLLYPHSGLGSRLYDAARLPVWRASAEIPLMVREALAPMDDIEVVDVQATQDENNPSTIDITLVYNVIDAGVVFDRQTLAFQIDVAG